MWGKDPSCGRVLPGPRLQRQTGPDEAHRPQCKSAPIECGIACGSHTRTHHLHCTSYHVKSAPHYVRSPPHSTSTPKFAPARLVLHQRDLFENAIRCLQSGPGPSSVGADMYFCPHCLLPMGTVCPHCPHGGAALGRLANWCSLLLFSFNFEFGNLWGVNCTYMNFLNCAFA